jgi:putative tryptophan/tyrosine transport system substrate-binding protein
MKMRRRDFMAGLGAAVWPLAAGAQQWALPVIGLVGDGTRERDIPFLAAFRGGLGEQGYVEGRNVENLYLWADSFNDRLLAMAADLASRRVAVIFAHGSFAAAVAAKSATTAIPIVFVAGVDPVVLGLVASLNRPGGNVTGVTTLNQEVTAKRLQMVHEILPAATRIGFLLNPTNPASEAEKRETGTAARILGLDLVMLNASTAKEIEMVFANLGGQRIDAVLAGSDPFFVSQRDQLVELAAHNAMPAIYHARQIVEAGGLMSYGGEIVDAYRVAGTYVGRILKGEKPADLPVQQSTRIEMALNLKAAKALGLTVPQSILLQANEVIE